MAGYPCIISSAGYRLQFTGNEKWESRYDRQKG